jgi:hypothetical protein
MQHVMKGVFTRVNFEERIPFWNIIATKRMLIALLSSINTRCTMCFEITMEMTRASTFGKVTHSQSSGVKAIGLCY